jgi:hypothetical protein
MYSATFSMQGPGQTPQGESSDTQGSERGPSGRRENDGAGASRGQGGASEDFTNLISSTNQVNDQVNNQVNLTTRREGGRDANAARAQASASEATDLRLPADVIKRLRDTVFGFDTFFVTGVENYDADGVLFKGNLRGDPQKSFLKLELRLKVCSWISHFWRTVQI